VSGPSRSNRGEDYVFSQNDLSHRAVALIACAIVCLAQVEQGAITGAVVDSTGASVPKAKVTATNQATGTIATSETTDDGYYKIPYLPAGNIP